MLQEVRELSEDSWRNQLKLWGQPEYRAKQILEWAWKKQAKSFEEMTNLPVQLRERLSEQFYLSKLQLEDQQRSSDGAIKYSIKLPDNQLIEGVLIPHLDRVTACVSAQVGCALACKFCATGFLGFTRNLKSYEIYDQIALLQQQSAHFFGKQLSNIVFMGMGEALLNYRNVLQAIDYLTSNQGMNISAKRITVSSAGIAKMIRKLGEDNVRFEFALSLHAANDNKRSQIMPINEHNSLKAVKEALLYFYSKTKNQITLEYIIFDGFNDSLADAEAVYQFSRGLPCKVNIIEYNSVVESGFQNARAEKVEAFKQYLIAKGLIVNIRRSRGKDIDAACGQLALRKK